MRLQRAEREAIKETFTEVFGEGEVYLFGSRADDTRRGGDIDLYLITPENKATLPYKAAFLVKLKARIGEQRIDVVFAKDPSRSIEREARKSGVKL